MDKELGLKFKLKRIEMGKTAISVANELNLDRCYLSRIESGERKPSRKLFNKLCSYYKFSHEELWEVNILSQYNTTAWIVREAITSGTIEGNYIYKFTQK